MSRGSAMTIAQARSLMQETQQKIIADRISKLVGVYGSFRAVGRALRIDHAYLHRLFKGEKAAPSSAVLRKLGLDK